VKKTLILFWLIGREWAAQEGLAFFLAQKMPIYLIIIGQNPVTLALHVLSES